MLYEVFVFFQAEDGIRDLVRSRGLGDVYKRQCEAQLIVHEVQPRNGLSRQHSNVRPRGARINADICLLYTSDAADERSSVDLGGRRIINKKNQFALT